MKVVHMGKRLSGYRLSALLERFRAGVPIPVICSELGISRHTAERSLFINGLISEVSKKPAAPTEKAPKKRTTPPPAAISIDEIPLHIPAARCKKTGQWQLNGSYVSVQEVIRAFNEYVDIHNSKAGKDGVHFKKIGRV